MRAWGRLSDRIGRRPVILIGLLGAAASTIAFGLSRNLWTLMLSRTLQGPIGCMRATLIAEGALNGNAGSSRQLICTTDHAGVLKASLAELTTDENKGRAFALLPMVRLTCEARSYRRLGQLARHWDR